jgi:hypothetical protein
MTYVGLDVHKKTIAYCIKSGAGKLIEQGEINAHRRELGQLAARLKKPWCAALEATLFTGWIYDFLKPRATELKVAHPAMLKAISASKKKNDRSPTCCAWASCPSATWPAPRSASSAGCYAIATWC